jgi:A/G-specific adenine glycosylase
MIKDASSFTETLLLWWSTNKRHFPWRETNNAYDILVAEILLHRTKAAQVAKLYPEFLSAFPTPRSLADGAPDTIEKILKPLGLHWRTKLIHYMSKEIIEKFNGKIPQEKNLLISLPGVSDYISSAVMCFAYNYNVPLLDTNTVRVIGRFLGIKINDGSRRNNQFRKAYSQLFDQTKATPREFAFAIIDFAALVCLPLTPLCNKCVVGSNCMYKSNIDNEKEALL